MPDKNQEEIKGTSGVVPGKKTTRKRKATSPKEVGVPEIKELGEDKTELTAARQIQLELDGLLVAMSTKNEDQADLLLTRILKHPTRDFIYLDMDPNTLEDPARYRAYMDLTMYMALLQECRIKSRALMAYLDIDQEFTTHVTKFSDAITRSIYRVAEKPTQSLAESSALYCLLKSFRTAKYRMVCSDLMPESKLDDQAFDTLSEAFRFVYNSARNTRRLVKAGSGKALADASNSTTMSKTTIKKMDSYLEKILKRFGG